MRTENPTSPATVVARVRAQVHRVRRLLAARGPIFRWSLSLSAVAVLVALVYVASPLPSGSEYLRSGQPFSSDDIIKITRALDAKPLPYRVDDRGRIEVPGDRLDEARAVLAKLDVGPRPIDEIEETIPSSFWDGLPEQEQRIKKAREEVLAALIRQLEGINDAHVWINRPKTRVGFRPTSNATAFVWLETEGNREIGPTTVQSIQNILVGKEPDLKPDAMTVFDQKGRHYLIAGNSTLGKMTKDRAREVEFTEKILEKLDWIKGVRVTVQMVPAPASPPPPPPSSTPTPTTEATVAPESSVGVNKPLELDPPPSPGPALAVAPSPSPAKLAEDHSPARVLVYVPRSFYLKAMPNREPSQEDLQSARSSTETRIRTAVNFVVPPGELHEVMIDTIPDDEPASPPRMNPPATEARRSIPWWVPSASAGAGMATLLVVAFRVLASRRPEARPAATAHRGRYTVDDAPSEPGPGTSERVRELIRLNPESAASVLHRWIGQGGGSA
jgi:flagellar biosynthesis/type III secretory pathway M-ring protein FliF/YscJ